MTVEVDQWWLSPDTLASLSLKSHLKETRPSEAQPHNHRHRAGLRPLGGGGGAGDVRNWDSGSHEKIFFHSMIHDTAPITMSMASSGYQVESVFNTMKYDHALIVHIRQPTTEPCEPGIATTSGHEQPHVICTAVQ